MELDEFKALYQARFEQIPDKSRADLEEMLRKRSHTAIERILRNLLWEVGAALVIMVALAFVMATWSSKAFRWAGMWLVILSVVQVVTFVWQYRQLRARLNQPTGSVRYHLQEMVAIVGRFVRVYYRYCLSSIPIGLVLGGYIGATADDNDPAFSALPEKPTILFVAIAFVLTVLLVISTYFMLRWYIHRLYGRYLEKLNVCLRDLNEAEH